MSCSPILLISQYLRICSSPSDFPSKKIKKIKPNQTKSKQTSKQTTAKKIHFISPLIQLSNTSLFVLVALEALVCIIV